MIFILKTIFWLTLLTLGLAAMSLAPWVPTRKKDLKRINWLADLKSGQVFYDLGCGDGRVSAYISQNSPGEAIGIELAIPFFIFCKIRQWLSGNKKLKFKLGNLFNIDLSQADAVYLFAADRKKLTGKIVKKLENELKSGAKIISYAFPIAAWQPLKTDQASPEEVAIYLYVKK